MPKTGLGEKVSCLWASKLPQSSICKLKFTDVVSKIKAIADYFIENSNIRLERQNLLLRSHPGLGTAFESNFYHFNIRSYL